jgi:hypothetical protein
MLAAMRVKSPFSHSALFGFNPVVWLVACPVAPGIEQDHLVTIAERGNKPELAPGFQTSAETMVQDKGRTMTLYLVVDTDALTLCVRHAVPSGDMVWSREECSRREPTLDHRPHSGPSPWGASPAGRCPP